MSRERIRWIVALMAVGLLGLVGFQLYWINSALHLQQEQFTYKVTDALQEVVRTLERQEIVYLTRQRVQAQAQQQRLMAIGRQTDVRKKPKFLSAGPLAQLPQHTTSKPDQPLTGRANSADRLHRLMPTTTVTPSDALHPTVQPLTLEQAQVVEAFFRQQDELMAVGDWQTQMAQQHQFEQWVDQVLASQLSVMNTPSATGSTASPREEANQKRVRQQNARRMVEEMEPSVTRPLKEAARSTPVSSATAAESHKMAEQSRMIKDVLKGLLLSDRPIEERLNRLTLDTLLRQALQERGIDLSFEYGVRTDRSSNPSHFLFASHRVEAARLAQSGYKAALFPNNILETGNYVYVFFPNQEEFIWQRMAMTLAGSGVLILVIMACFYIAISTIMRQKKLADIKNDFINNMTHEFKTPISTISLAVEMAQEQLKARVLATESAGALHPGLPDFEKPDAGQPDGRLMRYMGIIRDETRRLGSHVEKVLQMALLDRGEIKLKLSPVNIHDAIENVLNNLGLQLEQRGGELDLDFEAESEIIEADEVHLTNILYNLVDNAIKYSPDLPHLSITTRSLPEGISISVSDRGIGMTKEQLSRIFEKFYRVPTGNRHDVKGFGLGLSYVRKMVDEHHGQIRVESQPGQGSLFELFFPYSQNGPGLAG